MIEQAINPAQKISLYNQRDQYSDRTLWYWHEFRWRDARKPL